MNLEANYRLHLARKERDEQDKERDEQEIVRKSRLYELAPISEITKRGWIQTTDLIDELEQSVCQFLGITSPEESPQITINFRHSQTNTPETQAQIAWLKRVEHLSKEQKVAKFERVVLKQAIPDILTQAVNPENLRRIPTLLLSLGVHFVVVPHLQKTYLDGAAFYLNGNPVVALTLRYDRIDCFWFTLMHELAHITTGHKGIYLDDLDKGDINAEESAANRLSRDWLLNSEAFAAFVKATKPYFSRKCIEQFAQSQGRHPGIVLGRLQRENEVGYKHLRTLLVKVSPYLQEWIDVPTPQ